MSKRDTKRPNSGFYPLSFLEEIPKTVGAASFRKALAGFLEDKEFRKSQKEISKEMTQIKKALSQMDEAEIAFEMMMGRRKKLQSEYQEILETTKN